VLLSFYNCKLSILNNKNLQPSPPRHTRFKVYLPTVHTVPVSFPFVLNKNFLVEWRIMSFLYLKQFKALTAISRLFIHHLISVPKIYPLQKFYKKLINNILHSPLTHKLTKNHNLLAKVSTCK